MPVNNQLNAKLENGLKQFCQLRMSNNHCNPDDCENCPIDAAIHLIQEDGTDEQRP